jgi:hypothetical protein
MMIKYLVLLSVSLSACGGAEQSDDGQELGTSQAALTLSTNYGVRGGAVQGEDTGGRCAAGASGTCFVPRYKTIEFRLSTNGVPLNADRNMFATELNNARGSNGAGGVAGGFSFLNFQQRGWCQSGHICVQVNAQSATLPNFNSAWTPTTSIRRYIQCIPEQTQAMGEGTNVSTFGLMTCNINFVGLKAFKGIASATACPNSTACSIQELMYYAVAQAAGNGWTKNSSGNNTGVDFDVSPTTTAIGAGDSCRRADYDSTSPHMVFRFETCQL